jgi:DNA-binding CsgD family transcriptional regulator/PAS domain-containing protein
VADVGIDRLEPRLLGSLYEAALSAEIWPAVLDQVSAALGGEAAMIAWIDLKAEAVAAGWTSNIDGKYLDLFHSRYVLNPWSQGAIAMAECEVFRTEALLPLAELKRTRFFDELVNPLGIQHGIGCNLLAAGDRVGVFFAFRSKRHGPFGGDAVTLGRQLTPHLSRAFELTLQAMDAKVEQTAALRALDFIQLGIVLLDLNGRVYHVNSAAQRILDTNDGLAVVDDELCASDEKETAELQRRIKAAARNEVNGGTETCEVASLSRPSLDRSLEVLVARLHTGRLLPAPSMPAVVVFVSDPVLRPQGYEEILQRIYGLTRAEAKLTLYVIQGIGLSSAAKQLGIRLSTARSQVQKVYQKTGTGRQAELVNLLMHGALLIRPE